MAVNNPSGLTISNPQIGIQYTKVTDSSADWSSVANSTYFYDIATALTYYKDSTGTVQSLFGGSVPQAYKIYVDSVNGVNTTGNGNLNNPYLTPEFALSDIINTGTVTATTTLNSNVLTSVSSTTNILVGQYITGTNIPFDSIVIAKTSNTITINRNATANGSITATWWTVYNVVLNGNFTVASNIAKSGMWIDSTNATINFGGIQLFSYAGSLIPENIKLGRTIGTNASSCLINTTSNLPYLYLNYGNYYSIGTVIQLGSLTNALGVTNFYCEGNYFDARFGNIGYLNIGTSGYIKGDFYGLLGGFTGSTINTIFNGRITTPTSVNAASCFGFIDAIVIGNVTITDGAIVYGKITCTTLTINFAASPYYSVIYADVLGNIVSNNGVKIYGKIAGNFTNSGPATISDANLYGGIYGTITATSGTTTIFGTGVGTNAVNTIACVVNAGTIINKADINISTISYTGAGKFINNHSGQINIGSALNVGAPITLSQGTFVNEGYMYWSSADPAAFINKTGGSLFSNGKWYNPFGMYVSYSTNTSPAKDVLLGYSIIYGNSNCGTDKCAGSIRRLGITAANLATSVTINDGTNTITVSTLAGTKTQAQIIAELITAIQATALIYQGLTSFGTQLLYIGGSAATVTFTSLTNCTDNGTYNGGGGFAPNVLSGGGSELKGLNFNM